MFELKDGIYELRYTLTAVQTIEYAAKKSIIEMIQSIPSILEMKNLIAFALYNEQGQQVSSQRGMAIAEEIIMQYGMLGAFNQVVERVGEDCGFLFQVHK